MKKVELKKSRLRKHIGIKLATNPGQMVLLGIIVFNILLFLISAVIIAHPHIPGSEGMIFPQAAFCAIRVIMTGNIDFVIDDIGGGGVAACVVCVITNILGMIFFTGSLIAYLTNTISKFMGYSNPVGRTIQIYDHIIFLGWNSRAPEILRSLLYTGKKHEVIILTPEDREKIKEVIDENIADAIITHNKSIKEASKSLSHGERARYFRKNKLRNRLVIMIRQGETYSSQQLKDIALSMASAVIVLGKDKTSGSESEQAYKERFGNAQILKTVMQVVDITSSEDSANDQNVIVEIDDDMTLNLIRKVIQNKNAPEKCSVIPMPVSRTIGSLVAMFALTPSLGEIYNEIFTIGGVDIGVEKTSQTNMISYVRNYLNTHVKNLPLNIINAESCNYGFYAGTSYEKSIESPAPEKPARKIQTAAQYNGIVNDIIMIGHSSKLNTIVSMIDRALADRHEEVRILLADDHRRLGDTELKYCKLSEVYSTDADARDFFFAFRSFINESKRGVTIVLLSDDSVSPAEMDDETIANLIRLKEIQTLLQQNGAYVKNIQIVVEIINPSHYDIVKNYGVKNIIISNRLTSKMITQFAFDSSLFNLYRMMISKYGMTGQNSGIEIFTQYAKDFFVEDIPQNVNADELVKAVFESTLTDKEYVILMGFVDENGNMHLFDTDRRTIYPSMTPDTLLVCYRGRIY